MLRFVDAEIAPRSVTDPFIDCKQVTFSSFPQDLSLARVDGHMPVTALCRIPTLVGSEAAADSQAEKAPKLLEIKPGSILIQVPVGCTSLCWLVPAP
jgi:hypothetical protein